MSDIDDVASGALRRSRRMVVAREAGLGRGMIDSPTAIGEDLIDGTDDRPSASPSSPKPLDAGPPTWPSTTLTGEKHDAYVAWVAATRAVEAAQAMADQVIAAARQPLTAAQEAFREALQRLAKAATA